MQDHLQPLGSVSLPQSALCISFLPRRSEKEVTALRLIASGWTENNSIVRERMHVESMNCCHVDEQWCCDGAWRWLLFACRSDTVSVRLEEKSIKDCGVRQRSNRAACRDPTQYVHTASDLNDYNCWIINHIDSGQLEPNVDKVSLIDHSQ